MIEILSETWSNLRANKLRSFLTMFGIVWGVISIVVLSAMGTGFQAGNQQVLEELGKNIVIIRNGRTSLQAGGARTGRIVRLSYGDVQELRQQSRLIQYISPELMRGAVRVKSSFNARTLQMSGVWPVYQQMRTIEVDRGRLLSEMDNADARRVVIIGYEASAQLFADRDPVGAEIKLNSLPYAVVGRIRKKNQDSNYTGRDDERLFVPYETMRKDFPLTGANDTPDMLSTIIAAPYDHVTQAMIREFERLNVGIFGLDGRTPIEAEIRRILSRRHLFDPKDVEALAFWNTALESAMFSKMMRAMSQFFLAVSLVTLALGGIGVMNIMLVAVRERTREIGVRKAIGATARRIQWQFFSEGFVITMASGVFGFLLGAGLCSLVNLAPKPARFAGMIITWETGLFAVLALAIVGVAAATYPARRAALLPPIEALRYDV
ncbi:MAG: ABC transporter permease [Acidobacteria bacterium]|nr:ABC transporter permease [Acidobacteriota bacterium]